MSKVEELSRQYAEQQVKDSPDNEYKGYSFELQKELTKFDGYDIEQAYEDGYKQAEKDLELDWEDMFSIFRLVNEVLDDYADGKTKKEVGEEVLKRFKAQKREKV